MTPADVAAMTLDQFQAFQEEMAAEIRATNKAMEKARSRARR